MIVLEIRRFVRLLALSFCQFLYCKIYHMNIESTARISFGARLDKSNPRGIM